MAQDERRVAIVQEIYPLQDQFKGLSTASQSHRMCEEAGIVLESHPVAALLLSPLQPMILVGDHLQHRPQILSHTFSMDSKQGYQVRFDESLQGIELN